MNFAVLNRRRLLGLFLDNLVWAILVVILVIFSVAIPGFYQVSIFTNIIYHATFVGILAVGLSFCIISGHLDLSIESVMALAAMLVAWLPGGSPGAPGVRSRGGAPPP